MSQYKKELETFVSKKYLVAFVIFIIVVAYGFDLTNLAVNTDSIAGDIYSGSGHEMLSAGRFGTVFWGLLTWGTDGVENSFATGVIGLAMFAWAAINFCILFKRASGNVISTPAYTVFVGMLVSYPLMNEIWEYYAACSIGGGFLFVSFSLLLIYDQLEKKKFNPLSVIAVFFFMTIVCAGYESLVAVYIFGVFALLYLEERKEANWKKHLRQGFIYCGFLIAGIILRLVVHRIFLLIYQLEATSNGDTEIAWLTTDSIWETLEYLVASIAGLHIVSGLFYFPLAVMCIAWLVVIVYMIVLFAKKKTFQALLVLGMLFSTEALSILKGNAAPYRTCQVFAIFVAFAAMMLANKIRYKNIVAFCLCFLCLQQAIYMNYIFTLNHERSEEEKATIIEIGQELESSCDTTKPVVFVGGSTYQVSDYIYSRVSLQEGSFKYNLCVKILEFFHQTSYLEHFTTYPRTNVRSVIGWSCRAGGTYTELLFEYYGYDLEVADSNDEIYESVVDYLQENEMSSYPSEGYIVELDDVIIVKLGELSEGELSED